MRRRWRSPTALLQVDGHRRKRGEPPWHQHQLLHLPGRLTSLVGPQIRKMPEGKTAWTKPLLPKHPKCSPRSRLLKWLRSLLPPKKKPRRLQSRLRPPEPKKRGRGRPPGSKNKPKPPPPVVDVAPVRAPSPVPAPVEEPEQAPEPEPTPAMMRAMRQVSRTDRFEELLSRNTMEF